MPFPVPPAVEAELRRINAEVEAAFKAGDYARLVDALYHKDAKALPPGIPAVSSHSSLCAMWRAMKEQHADVAYAKFTVVQRYAGNSSPQPDSVSEMGAYAMYNSKDEVVEIGKSLVLWTRTADGSSYKQLFDMFSPDSVYQ